MTAARLVLATSLVAALGSMAAGVSSGVPPGLRAGAGSQTLSLSIGGHARTAIVHVPSGYRGARPVPLVLNMHGSGSTAETQEKFTGMDATADSAGFIVAYPQALTPDGTGSDWNIPRARLIRGRAVPAGAADDVSFLTTLVGRLGRRYCIDAHRVYATGFSGGARMSSQLGCDTSNVFAAVAPVSGLRLPTPCPAKQAVPVISFHGTVDPVDPYAGHGASYWTYSVPAAKVDWARHDGCASSPTVSHPASTVTLTTYAGCRTAPRSSCTRSRARATSGPTVRRYRVPTWRCSGRSRPRSTRTG